MAGTSGVNRYNASVTSGTDGSFAIDAPISTKMAGPEDAMAAESAYLPRLQAATSYQVDGDTLVLDDADGQPHSPSPAPRDDTPRTEQVGDRREAAGRQHPRSVRGPLPMARGERRAGLTAVEIL